MSAIHVKTLVEALDRPSTLKALARKTGYPEHLVIRYIQEARVAGHTITAVARGRDMTREPTYYRLEVPHG